MGARQTSVLYSIDIDTLELVTARGNYTPTRLLIGGSVTDDTIYQIDLRGGINSFTRNDLAEPPLQMFNFHGYNVGLYSQSTCDGYIGYVSDPNLTAGTLAGVRATGNTGVIAELASQDVGVGGAPSYGYAGKFTDAVANQVKLADGTNAITATGTINGTTLTDGTATITGGAITGATNTNWDIAYNHSQVTTGNPHAVIQTEVNTTSLITAIADGTYTFDTTAPNTSIAITTASGLITAITIV